MNLSKMLHSGSVAEQAFRDRLAARGLGRSPSLSPRVRGGSLPLSFAQERLWVLEQLGVVGPAYNIVMACRLEGRLDVAALEASLEDVVHRHESLRTHFTTVEGEPRQIVQPPAPFEIRRLSLADVESDRQQVEVDGLVAAELNQPFDLARGPLIRASLVELGGSVFVLVIAMHHIVSDGWSSGVLTRDLSAFYSARTTGAPLPLPLAVQYPDFVLWQRERLTGGLLEEQLSYWKNALAGAAPVLNLPLDKPRPAQASFDGDVVRFTIDAPTREALLALALEEGATLYMVLLAAFQVLLSRWTGQTDILVGSPIAGRTDPALDPLVGFFVNTLVLRADVSDNPPFRRLLRQVKNTALDAYAHQELPFEKLVAELQPERDLARNPIFEVTLAFHTDGDGGPAFAGVTSEPVTVTQSTAKFDLSLHLRDNRAGLVGGFEFRSSLFEKDSIRTLADQFVSLLDDIVRDPERNVASLSLLGPRQAREFRVTFGAPEARFPSSPSLHEIFSRRAAEAPAKVALVLGDEELTYGDLERRAAVLAHRLMLAGLEPGDIVGLYAERCIDLIVSIFAILKAGGAYLPLDPEYPPDRLAFIVEDAGASFVITQPHLAGRLPASATPFVLDAGDDRLEAIGEPASAGRSSGAVAYVIYTSGSTGQPKGTLVSHANVVRLLNATQDWFSFGTGDVWTVFHSFAFDFSVWELFGSLLSGGTAVIVPTDAARSPELFFELLSARGVTVLNQTPSAFRRLMNYATARERLPSLRLVIFGGEELNPKALKPWTDRYGWQQPALVNMYGITETTVHVSYRPLLAEDLDGPVASPIGRPIPDLKMYLLDEALEPVPRGIPGEIFVAGAGLAHGYLNRAALTAERFVPNPFSTVPGQRLYRTGDIARERPGGEFEFLGRSDRQAKLRGYRIELGEIEAALLAAPEVAAAIVRIVGDDDETRRIAAWIVPSEAAGVSVEELRRLLGERLPKFMIPSVFVIVAAIPLTSNGKVDEAALPVPEMHERSTAVPFRAPATTEEKALAAIWRKVLHLSSIGVDDNFFASGGDSLRALQVAREARDQGLPVATAEIFMNQTIRALAAACARRSNAPAMPPPQRVGPLPVASLPAAIADVEDAYPLTSMQDLMIRNYGDPLQSDAGIYHAQQVVRLRVDAPDSGAMRDALAALMMENPILRTRFATSVAGEMVQYVSARSALEIEVLGRLADSGEEYERRLEGLMRDDRRMAFRIGPDPSSLVRFYLITRSSRELDLLMSIHHAIDDGWGNQSFLARLFHLYGELSDGRQPALVEAGNVFKEHVALEKHHLAVPAARRFWDQFADADGLFGEALLPRLPANPAAPRRDEFLLPSELITEVVRFARRSQNSLKSILLTLFRQALAEVFGLDEIVVGIVANGRTDALSDPFDSLGLFWSFAPFFDSGRPEITVADFQRTDRILAAMEPYNITACGSLFEQLDRQSLFFATFNYVNFHNSALGKPTGRFTASIVKSHDRFHYPLNTLFSLDEKRHVLFVRTEYDPTRVEGERVLALHEILRTNLGRIAGSAAAEPTS